MLFVFTVTLVFLCSFIVYKVLLRKISPRLRYTKGTGACFLVRPPRTGEAGTKLGHMPSCSLLSLPPTFFSLALEGLHPLFFRKLLPTELLF